MSTMQKEFRRCGPLSAIRSLQENTHQGVSGRTDISTKFSADYALSDRVNIQLFYDRMVAKYEVATSFDTANNSFGLKLRDNNKIFRSSISSGSFTITSNSSTLK